MSRGKSIENRLSTQTIPAGEKTEGSFWETAVAEVS